VRIDPLEELRQLEGIARRQERAAQRHLDRHAPLLRRGRGRRRARARGVGRRGGRPDPSVAPRRSTMSSRLWSPAAARRVRLSAVSTGPVARARDVRALGRTAVETVRPS
jgi:hypothetical protein